MQRDRPIVCAPALHFLGSECPQLIVTFNRAALGCAVMHSMMRHATVPLVHAQVGSHDPAETLLHVVAARADDDVRLALMCQLSEGTHLLWIRLNALR